MSYKCPECGEELKWVVEDEYVTWFCECGWEA